MNVENQGLKRIVRILIILAGISVTICLVSAMMYFHKGKDSVTELLDLGQTYLEDEKYEQAVASLEAILRIDPKEARTEEERELLEDKNAILEQLADAYLAWADDEIAKENYDRTWEILEEGQEKTKDERFERKFNEVYALQHPIDEAEIDAMQPILESVVFYCLANDLMEWKASYKEKEDFWGIMFFGAGYWMKEEGIYPETYGTDNADVYFDKKTISNGAYAIFPDFEGQFPEVSSIWVYDDSNGLYGVPGMGYDYVDIVEQVAQREVNPNQTVDIVFNGKDDREFLSADEAYRDRDYKIHLIPNLLKHENGDTEYCYCVESVEQIADRGTYRADMMFTEEELRECARNLGVPDGMDVDIYQGKPSYWEAGGSWMIFVDVVNKNGDDIAYAQFAVGDTSPGRTIWNYFPDN